MRMMMVPHGSWHQVVLSPATSAMPFVRNTTPRPSRSERVAARSSQTMPRCVMPTLVTEGSTGPVAPIPAAGYSISSTTRSSCPRPRMAAVTTTGGGTSSPMSCSICSPCIVYGGDSTCRPRTSEYQRTASSMSGTQTAVWARPVSTHCSVGPRSRGMDARGWPGGCCSVPASDLALQATVPVAKREAQPRLEHADYQEAHQDERREDDAHGAQHRDAHLTSCSPLSLHATVLHREITPQKCRTALSSTFSHAVSNEWCRFGVQMSDPVGESGQGAAVAAAEDTPKKKRPRARR